MIRPSIQIAVAFLVFALSLAGIWHGATGLIEGEVAALTRFSHFTVYRATSPGWYWIDVLAWFASGFGLAFVGWINFREARIAMRRKRVWRGN